MGGGETMKGRRDVMERASSPRTPSPEEEREKNGIRMYRRFIPEGHAKIAQRFNVGTSVQSARVPKGRLKTPSMSVVPSGLNHLGTLIPRLKPWAIFACPYGTKKFIRIVVRSSRSNRSGIGLAVGGSLGRCSADFQSAVSQNCILPHVQRMNCDRNIRAVPITNRRY